MALGRSKINRGHAAALLGRILQNKASLRGSDPWVHDVCSGVLRWKSRIDAFLKLASKNSPTGWIKRVLEISVYQIWFHQTVGGRTIISETLSEIQKKEGRGRVRYVQAVLEKALREKDIWTSAEHELPDSQISEAEWFSISDFWFQKLSGSYSLEWIKKYLLRSLMTPSYWIRHQDGRPERMESSTALEKIPGFKEGKILVQNISSQLAVKTIADLLKTKGFRDRKVLDLCAAPGGKAVAMAWEGFEVVATDTKPARKKLLLETVKRCKAPVEVQDYATVFETPSQTKSPIGWPIIWIDAPCSGSGVFQKLPEIKWTRSEEDVKNLTTLQRELVHDAWQFLQPGGILVYSVCSILKEEIFPHYESLSPQATLLFYGFFDPFSHVDAEGIWCFAIQKQKIK